MRETGAAGVGHRSAGKQTATRIVPSVVSTALVGAGVPGAVVTEDVARSFVPAAEV